MIDFVTLSDKNYLINGLVLYNSLKQNITSDFTLHYLCLDDITYSKLYKLKEEKSYIDLKLYRFDVIQNLDDWQYLIKNTENRSIDKADGQSTFHWALASVFTNYLMNIEDRPLLYIDSDICVYNDLGIIFDKMIDYNVGLISHKHISPKEWSHVGYYNVGIIYFNNTNDSKLCLQKWKDCVIGKDLSYPKYKSCGDQKYLELFITWIDKIILLDSIVGHSAPWCAGHHEIYDKNNVKYLKWPGFCFDRPELIFEQPLYFYHFSHFTPDYTNNTWKKDRDNEWCGFLGQPGMTEIYQEYFEKGKQWI